MVKDTDVKGSNLFMIGVKGFRHGCKNVKNKVKTLYVLQSLGQRGSLGRLSMKPNNTYESQTCPLNYSDKTPLPFLDSKGNFHLKLRQETSGNQASCSMRLLKEQLRCILPSMVLLGSSTLHLARVSFHLLSLSLLDDGLEMSVFLFFGCFATFAVVAKAGGEIFPPQLFVIVSCFNQLRRHE